MSDKLFNIENVEKIKSVASIVAVLLIGYYATGLYLNILEIKKIKEQK